MNSWFNNRKIIKAVAIRPGYSSIHDRGVFAHEAFRAGMLIEKAPMILLTEDDSNYLKGTGLYRYYFVIADKQTPMALGLGYSSLYNHSPNANAVYSVDIKNQLLIFRAVRDIDAGEEITINYHGSPDDKTPVWFAES